MAEAFVILKRKSRDQIQMLMYILPLLHFLYGLLNFIKTGLSPYFPDGLFIGGLYPDLKLDQPRPHGSDQTDLFLCQ